MEWSCGRALIPGEAGMDPLLAPVLPVLLFPDGYELLERVDEPAAGLEGLLAMGAAHRYDDADLTQFELSDPVDQGQLDDRPAPARFRLELGQLLEGHLGIGLIGE